MLLLQLVTIISLGYCLRTATSFTPMTRSERVGIGVRGVVVGGGGTLSSLTMVVAPAPSGDERGKRTIDQKSLIQFTPQVSRSLFSLPELLTPPQLDAGAVLNILASQGLLFLLAIVGELVVANQNMFLQTISSFDRGSMTLALQLSSLLLAAGFVFDRVPNVDVQNIVNDTRIYVLRVFGRNTPGVTAFFAALLLSASAAISEELFFRGFLLVWIQSYFGTTVATIISSAIFGLAHFPVFGASAYVEAVLGGIFAFAFTYSNLNIAVPIAVHTLYDLGTIYFIWLTATRDMRDRISRADEQPGMETDRQLKDASLQGISLLPAEVVASELALFNFLDRDQDGFISYLEFDAGLKLMGVSSVAPYALPFPWQKQLFKEIDTDNDGKISFEEFNKSVVEATRKWLKGAL